MEERVGGRWSFTRVPGLAVVYFVVRVRVKERETIRVIRKEI